MVNAVFTHCQRLAELALHLNVHNDQSNYASRTVFYSKLALKNLIIINFCAKYHVDADHELKEQDDKSIFKILPRYSFTFFADQLYTVLV